MDNIDSEEAPRSSRRQAPLEALSESQDSEVPLEAGIVKTLMTFRSRQVLFSWKFRELGTRMVLPCVDHVPIVDWRQATGVMQEM